METLHEYFKEEISDIQDHITIIIKLALTQTIKKLQIKQRDVFSKMFQHIKLFIKRNKQSTLQTHGRIIGCTEVAERIMFLWTMGANLVLQAKVDQFLQAMVILLI